MRNKNNLREIRVFAQRRSGHHGIVGWLLGHFSGEKYHYNNVTVREFSEDPEVRDERFFEETSEGVRNCYLFNVESENLDGIMDRLADNRWFTHNGPSVRVDHVLVLRDPFNQIASFGKIFGVDVMAEAAVRWKQYAREFIRAEKNLPEETVRVSYNAWFQSKEYRRMVSEKLGLSFTDAALRFPYGYPSSFEPDVADAQALSVLTRWETYLGTEPYSGLMLDPELNGLAEEIFGDPAVRIRKEIESQRKRS